MVIIAIICIPIAIIAWVALSLLLIKSPTDRKPIEGLGDWGILIFTLLAAPFSTANIAQRAFGLGFKFGFGGSIAIILGLIAYGFGRSLEQRRELEEYLRTKLPRPRG